MYINMKAARKFQISNRSKETGSLGIIKRNRESVHWQGDWMM